LEERVGARFRRSNAARAEINPLHFKERGSKIRFFDPKKYERRRK